MVKYIATKHDLFKVSESPLQITETKERATSNINWIYPVDEDGEFNDKLVKKGDIIVLFYDYDPIIIDSDSDLGKTFNKKFADKKVKADEWAAKNCVKCSYDCEKA